MVRCGNTRVRWSPKNWRLGRQSTKQSTLSVIIIVFIIILIKVMINAEVSEYDHSQENVHKSESDFEVISIQSSGDSGWMDGWRWVHGGSKWIEIVKFGFLSPPISYSSHLTMSFGLSDLTICHE